MENNTKEREQEQSYKEFCNRLDKWVITLDKLCKNKEDTFKDTKNVEQWYETFKKTALGSTNRNGEIGTIISAMFEIKDTTDLDKFGLKSGNLEIYDMTSELVSDHKYIQKRTNRLTSELYNIMMQYHGEDVLKQAMGNLGGVTGKVFQELQKLWETRIPQHQLELPCTHMIYLLKKGKYNEKITTASEIVKKMEHYTGLESFQEILEKYNGEMRVRDILLEIDEMANQFLASTKRQQLAWVYDFGFKIASRFMKEESKITFKRATTKFMNKLTNSEDDMNYESFITDLEATEQNGGGVKKNLEIIPVKTYDERNEPFVAIVKERVENNKRKWVSDTYTGTTLEKRDGSKKYPVPLHYKSNEGEMYCRQCGCGHQHGKHHKEVQYKNLPVKPHSEKNEDVSMQRAHSKQNDDVSALQTYLPKNNKNLPVRPHSEKNEDVSMQRAHSKQNDDVSALQTYLPKNNKNLPVRPHSEKNEDVSMQRAHSKQNDDVSALQTYLPKNNKNLPVRPHSEKNEDVSMQRAHSKQNDDVSALQTYLPKNNKYNLPYGKYYERKSKNLTEEEEIEKRNYLDSQPARLHMGKSRALPTMPMFLQDVFYYVDRRLKTDATPAFFIGYNSDFKLIVKDVKGKTHVVTDYDPIQSLKLHQGEQLDPANVIPKLAYRVTQENTSTPTNIPTNFKQAQNTEWKTSNQTEINKFLQHRVFEEIDDESSIPAKSIYLNTFWLFTRKQPTNEAKSRLITINRDWVGKRNREVTSPVSNQLSQQILFWKFTKNLDTKFHVYDISTAFLHSVIPESEYYYLKTPIGFSNHIKTKYVRLRRYAYGLNNAPLEFHKTLTAAIETEYKTSLIDPCLHHSPNYDEFLVQHVDDILLLCKDPRIAERLLKLRFELKSDHDPSFYLGFNISQDDELLKINLEHFITTKIGELPQELQDYIYLGSHKLFSSSSDKELFPEFNQKISTELHEKNKWYDLPENKDVNSTFLVDYAMPDVTIESADFNTILPPQLEDLKRRKEFMVELNRLETMDLKDRYQQLEKLVAEAHQTRDITKFLKRHPALPHHLFSLNMYQQIVGLIVFIASKGRFDIQVHASFLSQHTMMPAIEHFQQALQVLKYLYTTRKSTYNYHKLLSPTTKPSEQDVVTIKVYTDASQLSQSSQGGYLIMIDNKYITSRSFRIKPYSASSFDCEILALRQGVNAGHLVKTTLYDLGYRNIRMEAFCDNKPVVDTVNKNYALKKPEKIYVN
ncbi:hypothetical protein CANINC_004012, partial [Pichia inconspicua]